MESEKRIIKISLSKLLLFITLFIMIILLCIIYILSRKYNNNTNSIQHKDEMIYDIESINNDDIKENSDSLVDNESQEEIELESENTLVKENNDEQNIILYMGYEIEPKIGVQIADDMKNTDEAKKKYNTTYYNYENGKYIGTTEGKFGEETFEGYSSVNNVKRIAMTKKYDAIPREKTRINKLPDELIDMSDCTSVSIDSIDLDGDGNEEKIVCYTDSAQKGEIGDGEPIAFSEIMLFDSNYKKIADLAILEDGFWAGFKEEDRKMFLSLDKTEYIDLDNDNIMEIIIELPTYEGIDISILKYSNGSIKGETNYKASVLP